MTSYKLKKIDVQNEWAVNHICFVYNDDQTWSVGYKSGGNEVKSLILAPGEFIIRVTHEKYVQHFYAGAFVEFETNRGRVFSHKSYITTNLPSEITTLKSKPGHQITCLKIISGVLEGIVEEPLEDASSNTEIPKEVTYWFCLYKIKSNENIEYFDYFDRSKAIEGFQTSKRLGHTNLLLVDVKKNKIHDSFNTTGKNTDKIKELEERALSDGRLVKKLKDEKPIFPLDELKLFCRTVFDFKKDTKLIVIYLAMMIVSNFVNGYSDIIAGQIFSLYYNTQNTTDVQSLFVSKFVCKHFLENCEDIWSNRIAIISSMLILCFAQQICEVIVSRARSLFTSLKSETLQNKMFSHVMEQELGYHEEIGSISRIADSNNLLSIATDDLPNFISHTTSLATTLIIMLTLNPPLALLSLLIMSFTNFVLLRPIAKEGLRQRLMDFKVQYLLDEVTYHPISSISTVKIFSKEEEHENELKITALRAKESARKTSFFLSLESSITSILDKMTYALVLFVSFWMFSRQVDLPSTGTIGTFILMFNRVESQVCSLISSYRSIVTSFSKVETTIKFLHRKTTLKSGPKKASPSNLEGSFQFKNVSFIYTTRPGKKVLEEINLNIPAGQTTAIVGESGSGKSTIAKLLMRLYDVTDGEIIVDGKYNIKEFDLRNYHDCISIVDQSPQFFGRTIRENIAYGSRITPTDDEILLAADQANAREFIDKLRTGLDTQVGQGGALLSGGQMQRLAIARAIMRKPKIFILDEATSSLDTINESKIHKNLKTLLKGKTVIIIAHRLCTIKDADQIICLKEGKVEETGTHSQLMEKNGHYAELAKTQTL